MVAEHGQRPKRPVTKQAREQEQEEQREHQQVQGPKQQQTRKQKQKQSPLALVFLCHFSVMVASAFLPVLTLGWCRQHVAVLCALVVFSQFSSEPVCLAILANVLSVMALSAC